MLGGVFAYLGVGSSALMDGEFGEGERRRENVCPLDRFG